MRPLDHPVPGFLGWVVGQVLLFLFSAPDVRDKLPIEKLLLAPGRIVGGIQAHVLGDFLRGLRPSERRGQEGVKEEFCVVDVGYGESDGHLTTVGQHRALDATWGASCRVGTYLFPPERAFAHRSAHHQSLAVDSDLLVVEPQALLPELFEHGSTLEIACVPPLLAQLGQFQRLLLHSREQNDRDCIHRHLVWYAGGKQGLPTRSPAGDTLSNSLGKTVSILIRLYHRSLGHFGVLSRAFCYLKFASWVPINLRGLALGVNSSKKFSFLCTS